MYILLFRHDTCAMDATVTICHRFTPPDDLKKFCKMADIVVVATGVPGLIRGAFVYLNIFRGSD